MFNFMSDYMITPIVYTLNYVWVTIACYTYIQPTTTRTLTSPLGKSAVLHNSLCDNAREEACFTDCTLLKCF